MTFSQAFEEAKEGKSIWLPHWGNDVSIRVQTPDDHSKMTAPYLYVSSRYGRVPWVMTQIELFSEEWKVSE